VTFYVANLASALPALFPTSCRYSSMGIAYNFSVAIFGGTTPFLVQGLIEATGDDMAPAYYLMATSVIGAIAIYFLKESARRPLPGSMPSVDTAAEAHALIAAQDNDPFIEWDETPFEQRAEASAGAARA
jgi:MHS family proline/betaine transporter-like MFS transporter